MGERICIDGNRAVIAQSVTSSLYRTKESDGQPWTSHLNQTSPKVKQSPYGPWGFQEAKAPSLQDNHYMKSVRLQDLYIGYLYPPPTRKYSWYSFLLGSQPSKQSAYEVAKVARPTLFLVLVSVRGWVDPRAIVQPKGLCQWKHYNDTIWNWTRDLLACRHLPNTSNNHYLLGQLTQCQAHKNISHSVILKPTECAMNMQFNP